MQRFVETARTLDPKLGALLFQLPPNLRKGLGLFDAFLDGFPSGVAAAFEFRHGSWLTDEIYERLRSRNLALCVTDSETMATPVEITAEYAYFRLRDEGYTSDDLVRWAAVIRERTADWWHDALETERGRWCHHSTSINRWNCGSSGVMSSRRASEA